jgi:hypothetical protein
MSSRGKSSPHASERLYSVQHIRHNFETGAGPLKRMIEKLSDEPAKLDALRSEIDSSISHYFEDNYLRMDYLMTKGQKK